jgi:hypothetical protein
MESLVQLLLEAPLNQKYANLMVKSGNQVSIFYNKKWIKVEPVKATEVQEIPSLIAYEVGKPDKLYSYEFDKITNWNLLSSKKADRAEKEKQRQKKEKKPLEVTPALTEPGGGTTTPSQPKSLPDAIKDAINNKRVVRLYYAGDKEEPPGWRTMVKPVFYGTATTKKRGVTPGQNYVRAWVESGKSVSGEKNPEKKKLPQWRFFREDRIKKWEVEGDKTFSEVPGPGYNPSDKMLDRRLAYAIFEANEAISEEAVLEPILEAVRIF